MHSGFMSCSASEVAIFYNPLLSDELQHTELFFCIFLKYFMWQIVAVSWQLTGYAAHWIPINKIYNVMTDSTVHL